MLHRYNSNLVANLKTYTPSSSYAAGDIVLYLDTDFETFDYKKGGLFRLKANFSSSGKINDDTKIIASQVLPDMYWEKIQKNILRSENFDTVQLGLGASYTFTHTSDPLYKRFYSLVSVIPATITQTLTFNTLTLKLWTPISTITHPVYIGNDAVKVTLNPQYRMRNIQSVNVAADLLANTGYILSQIRSVDQYGTDKFILYCSITGAAFQNLCVVYNSSFVYQYIVHFENDTPDYNYEGKVTANGYRLVVRYYDNQLFIYQINSTTKVLELKQTMGAWGVWIPQVGEIFDDFMAVVHNYHDIETYWTMYQPNPKNWYIHNYSGGSYNETGTYGNGSSITNQPHNFSILDTKYSVNSLLVCTTDYEGKFRNVIFISKDTSTNVANNLGYYGTAFQGTIYQYDDTKFFMLNFPSLGSNMQIGTVKNSSSMAFSGVNSSIVLKKCYKYDINIGPFSLNTQTYFVNTLAVCYGGVILQYSATLQNLTEVANIKTITWDNTITQRFEAGYVLSIRPINTTENKYICAVLNTPDNLYIGQLEYATQKYVSGGFDTYIITEAVSITSINIASVIPANTNIKVRIGSKANESTLYKYNGSSWVLEASYVNGNTIAEFNAANFATLIGQVGQTLFLSFYITSTDGISTPEVNSIAVNYFKGLDFKTYGTYFNAANSATSFKVEAISATQTKITNNTGVLSYIKGGVHFIV